LNNLIVSVSVQAAWACPFDLWDGSGGGQTDGQIYSTGSIQRYVGVGL